MKIRRIFCLLLLFFAFFCNASGYAQSEIVVPGIPQINMHAVDCHIRLLEFVLNTRLTVAQKDYFLAAIKEECAQMTTDQRKDFLEAVELVDSMAEMDEEQHATIQKVLAKDFAESAAEVADDPAAQMFVKLGNESFRNVIQEGEIQISQQSLEAFAEYVAFVAKPDAPEWLSEADAKTLQDRIMQSFASFATEEKEGLDGFHLTWFMIRAAWQGCEDNAKKAAWRKEFTALAIKAGEVPDVKKIRALLSTDIYGDLLDECLKLGVETLEWSSTTKFKVW